MIVTSPPLSAPPIRLSDIKQALQGPRPGLRGQALMAPRERLDPALYEKGSRDCRRAAVLLLLYPYRDELYTVFTLRPSHLPHHAGQISFPGGSRDGARETVETTALREAYEELGVQPDKVQILGRLTHIYIPPSHFCIQIVVGYTATRPHWRPNPAEVSELLEVPLRHFMDAQHRQHAWMEIRGERRRIPYFAVNQHRIWGATAMALGEFVVMLEEWLQNKTPGT